MSYPYFEEHEDSPLESGNRAGQFNFQRVFLTAFDDRWQFVRHHFVAGPFGLPASYSTDWPGVLADTFQIDRIVNSPDADTVTDPNTQQLTHSTLAKITIGYTPLTADELEQSDPNQQEPLPSGTFAKYNQSSNVEFREIVSRAMAWQSDGDILPPDVRAITPQAITTHTVEWSQVRLVPWVTIGNAKGCVNSVTCRLPGSPQFFAPETLLLEGMDDETTIDMQLRVGTRRLVLRFTEMAQKNLVTTADGATSGGTIYGWNHQWREDSGGYDRVVVARGSAPLYKTFDFNLLWSATV